MSAPGLFETIRARDGKLPFLARHLARLTVACQALRREPPAPGVAERVAAYAAGERIVRLTLDDDGERIDTRPVPPPAPLRTVISGTRHAPYPHKVTDRDVFDRARARVVPHRADEVILLAAGGVVAEGSISSVFFWRRDELLTPALDLGILPGVGRGRILELAREQGIVVREGRYTRAEVEGLPLFLVNAVRGVMETVAAGADPAPGDPRTHRLAAAFWG